MPSPLETVRGFEGEHRFLSNFYPSVIYYSLVRYPTVEHAYQAAKTLDLQTRQMISLAPSPGQAKRMGRKVALRADWEERKIGIMRTLLRKKFATKVMRDKLLATGSMLLVEYNTWGDRFWGVCDGRGQNHLGKLLMEIRKELGEAGC